MKRNLFIILKIKLLIFGLLLISCGKSDASTFRFNTNEKVHAIISVSNAEIFPFEPVSFVLELKNDTPEYKEITAQWVGGISIRKPGSGKDDWMKYQKYRSDGIINSSVPFSSKRIFAPDSVTLEWLYVIDLDQNQKPVFDSSGQYAIEVFYGIAGEPLNIKVLDLTGKDALAYKYISKNKLYKFFSEDGINSFSYSASDREKLEKVIKDYPDSKYANLSKISLGLMMIKGVDGKTDFKNAENILENAVQTSDKVLSLRADYYRAVALYKLNDNEGAKAVFQEIALQNEDKYFQYYSELIIKNNLKNIDQIHKDLFRNN